MPAMTPVSAAELASIQSEAVAAACDKSCQIWRKTTTSGTSGEPVASYTLIATVAAGMTQPTAGQLQNYDYLIGSLAAWHIKLPTGTDVRHQDQLVIDGQTLEVQVILTPQSYSVFESVLASEVK